MAHPKRKISKTRRDKRRTHDKATERTIAVCSVTNEPHLFHRAYISEGNLYYKGRVVIENYKPIA